MPKLLVSLALVAATAGTPAVVQALEPAAAACQGTTLRPGADLPRVLNAAPAGTTFCLSAGVYRLSAPLVPKSGTVLWGEPGAVLRGSREVTAEPAEGHWVVRGQEQAFVPPTTAGCADAGDVACHLPEAVFADGAPLRQVASVDQLGPGTFVFDPAADTVHLADDPAGRTIEVAVAPAAVAGFDGYQHHVTVRGLVIEQFAASRTETMIGAVRAGHDWVVEDNDIRFNSAAGVLTSERTVLRRNRLHHNGQYGFQGHADGLLAEDNEVAFNNAARFSANYAAGGSKIIESSDLVFRGNYVHDNLGPGLWTDGDNFNVLYEYNRLEDNVGPGIFHEISADAVIRHNTFRHNGTYALGRSFSYSAELLVNSSKNVEIHDNTIDAAVNGIGVVDADRGTGLHGERRAANVHVHDNDITMPSGGYTGMVGRSRAFTAEAGNRFEANTYRVPDLSGRYWKWKSSRTLSKWKAKGNDRDGVFLESG